LKQQESKKQHVETKGQDIVRCPNCGENKVQSQKGMNALIGFEMIGLGIIIPVVGWFVLLPVGIVWFIAALLGTPLAKNVTFRCQSCKHTFKVSKEDFKKYKEAIK